MPLTPEEYRFDPRPQFPFHVAMKRYSNLGEQNPGVTLILTHGTGFHKELWEPIIERTFTDSAKSSFGLRVRDAWAIDAPNHGDSATLNAPLLESGAYDLTFSWENYSRAIHLILMGLGTFSDGENRPVQLDFTNRRLIGIGHSLGAVSLILALTLFPVVKFDSLVLVEPTLITARHLKARGYELGFADGALARRDFWESKEEARMLLSARGSKTWDKRVTKLYVEFGLRETTKYDHFDRPGVTLKCTKVQESVTYRDRGSQVLAFDFLSSLCTGTPVHVIWGAIDDFISVTVKEDIHNNAFKGQAASIQWVEGCGHLAPLVRPDGVADAVLNVIGSESTTSFTKSRL